jgi:hypothetical protein
MSDRPREPDAPPDPSGIEEPHDVLAAEEFAMPTPEERYPGDPTGIEEPHDVLAAEEFAIPSPGERAAGGQPERHSAPMTGRAATRSPGGPSRRRLAIALVPLAALAAWLRRRR